MGQPDDDPTGMRDMLARLPDPGPMPESLVARIEAALAAEQAARGAPAGTAAARTGDTGTGRVSDLDARRPAQRRRHIVLVAGAAAAAVLAAVVTVPRIVGSSDATVSAGSAADATPGDARAGAVPEAGSGQTDGAAALPLADAPALASVTATAPFTSGSWATEVSAVLAAAPSPAAASVEGGTRTAPDGFGALTSADQVRRCLEALGVSVPVAVTVVHGSYLGSEAAVIVTPSGVGYLVDGTCGSGTPALIDSAPVTP